MAKIKPGEVFPSPTVKQVIFQITFPGLFYLESLIGDFQVKIMQRFPQSDLAFQKSILFAAGMDPEQAGMQAVSHDNAVAKIWFFHTMDRGVTLELKQNSLTIISKKHHSYGQGEGSFRSVIEDVVKNFMAVTQLPFVNRVGLRYSDECPLPEVTSSALSDHYEVGYSLVRFPVENCREVSFRAVVERDAGRWIIFQQIVNPKEENPNARVVLDFDAFCENKPSTGILEEGDRLHSIIRDEWERTIKDPVLSLMRKGNNQ